MSLFWFSKQMALFNLFFSNLRAAVTTGLKVKPSHFVHNPGNVSNYFLICFGTTPTAIDRESSQLCLRMCSACHTDGCTTLHNASIPTCQHYAIVRQRLQECPSMRVCNYVFLQTTKQGITRWHTSHFALQYHQA